MKNKKRDKLEIISGIIGLGIALAVVSFVLYCYWSSTPNSCLGVATTQEENIAAEPESEPEPEPIPQPTPQLRSLGTFTLTAYCPCYECCGSYALNRPKDAYGNTIVYTASSTIATAGRTIAVDPNVIPFGTRVIINGHEYVAEDTGSCIKGNKIDVYFPADAHEEARHFGVQTAEVFVKEEY